VYPEAFKQCKKIQVLNMDEVKFSDVREDFLFLQYIQTLTRLSLNKCTVYDMDNISFLPKIADLEELYLKGNGLLSIKEINLKFPKLVILDLSNNKIFSVEAVEALEELESLAEVSFENNPICVHKHLSDMIKEVNPTVEFINKQEIHEVGYKYKQ
jgi:Leucine-rich repeat (LRR) protein